MHSGQVDFRVPKRVGGILCRLLMEHALRSVKALHVTTGLDDDYPFVFSQMRVRGFSVPERMDGGQEARNSRVGAVFVLADDFESQLRPSASRFSRMQADCGSTSGECGSWE